MTTPKKEFPYRESPRVEKVKANLVENFGYGRREAKELALEMCANIDRHIALMQSTMKRLANQTAVIPTQTSFWRDNNG